MPEGVDLSASGNPSRYSGTETDILVGMRHGHERLEAQENLATPEVGAYPESMKKTVRLDDDVAALVEQAGRERSMNPEEVVNQVLREDLSRVLVTPGKGERREPKVFNLGPCFLDNLDDISGVLAITEGEDYK
ncbi:MAG TPA: hypothetical protein VE685_26430 [Thermoanaerobaculia bacterium]|nr:hypothetical protein [Thermoanaerobaculia bacterium]